MILNDNKAGMEGLDKESINKIIVDASKGSLYYENEQRKESVLKVKIENQRKLLAQITEEQKKIGLKIADELISKLESARDLGRSIVHLDMDAFYAAVEILSKPHLTHVPMAVGSNHMLSTSNYAARKFGVRAGMPGFIGKKLCPNLTIVPLNYPEYERYSRIMHGVLAQYDSKFCSVGLDEAYMDITELVNERMMKVRGEMVMRKKMTMMTKDASAAADDDDKFDDDDDEEEDKYDDKNDDDVAADESQRILQRSRIAEDIVSEIRQKIFEATSLTSSAGIACNAMLAKVCSDMNKPNGQFVVHSTKTDVMNFIRDLPIRKISGIGKVTEQMLKSLGIEKCSQLIEKRSILQCLYSKCTFGYLIRVGLGIGYDLCDRVDCDRKSLSVERTFEDTDDIAVASNICKNLCQMLTDDLNEKKLSAKTITLKIKTMKFEVKTRAKTLQTYTNQFCTIYLCAMSLLKDELAVCVSQSLKIRLMGVRASSFQNSEFLQKPITEMMVKYNNNNNKNNNNNMMNETSDDANDCSNNKNNNGKNDESSFNDENMDYHLEANDDDNGDNNVRNDDDDENSKIKCPICQKMVTKGADWNLINLHVDECLTLSYIKTSGGHNNSINNTLSNNKKTSQNSSKSHLPPLSIKKKEQRKNKKSPKTTRVGCLNNSDTLDPVHRKVKRSKKAEDNDIKSFFKVL